MASLRQDVDGLKQLLEAENGKEKDRKPGNGQVSLRHAQEQRRIQFGRFATLWNAAEDKGDVEVLQELQSLRPMLKIPVPRRTGIFQRCFMLVRLLVTAVVVSLGCLVLLLMSPVRLLHPVLRTLGVRNGQLPLDILVMLFFRAVLATMGVKVTVEGSSWRDLWGDRPCGVIVYNHTSNLDPFILNFICQGIGPKFVGKKVVFKLPIFGWLCLAMGMVPINRGDHAKAIKTMNETVSRIMQRWGRCVAIAPEGTRTTDGNLVLPFKKGAFHLQEQTGAPMLPVVIFGAFELWPPSQLFPTPGEVRVSFLPSVSSRPGHEGREETRVALQRSMAELAARRASWGARPLSCLAWLQNVLIFGATVVFLYYGLRLYAAVTAALGLSLFGVLTILAATTLIVAWGVDQVL